MKSWVSVAPELPPPPYTWLTTMPDAEATAARCVTGRAAADVGSRPLQLASAKTKAKSGATVARRARREWGRIMRGAGGGCRPVPSASPPRRRMDSDGVTAAPRRASSAACSAVRAPIGWVGRRAASAVAGLLRNRSLPRQALGSSAVARAGTRRGYSSSNHAHATRDAYARGVVGNGDRTVTVTLCFGSRVGATLLRVLRR
jgi:hypothetical protein